MNKLIIYFLLFTINSNLSPNYITIFAHGIVDKPSKIGRFSDAIATNQREAISFPDGQPATDLGLNRCIYTITSCLKKPANRLAMFMGKTKDIDAMQATVTQHPHDNIILYGSSRGAAAILHFMAQHSQENISALVLDGCPASMPDTIKPILASLGIHPSNADSIFQTIFPAYDPNGNTPLEDIKNIKNKDLPILLIASQTDTVVPFAHSLQLYKEFIKQGFTNVHLVGLPYGRHSFLLQDETIRPLYLKAVHTFYKKYQLPYNATYAGSEQELTSPNSIEIDLKIYRYLKSLDTVYALALKRNAFMACSMIALFTMAYIKLENDTQI